MDYQKEYASLVGQIDRAISVLDLCTFEEPLCGEARRILLTALQTAEERYIQE